MTILFDPQTRVRRVPALAQLASVVGTIVLFAVQIDDPWLALTLRGIAVAFTTALFLGLIGRPVATLLLATGILLLAPSFVGEQSGTTGALVLGSGALLAVALPVRGSKRRIRVVMPAVLLIAGLGMFWVGELVSGSSQAASMLMYFTLALIVVLICARDSVISRSVLVLIALFCAVLAGGAIATLVLTSFGIINAEVVPPHAYSWRSNFGYTTWGPLVISNSPGILGLPRISNIAGEPGTWAMICAIGVAGAAAISSTRPRLRAVVFVAAMVSLLMSQSSGAVVSLAIGIALASAAVLLSRRAGPRVLAAGVAGLAILAVPLLLVAVTESKASENLASLLDRGIGFLGGYDVSRADTQISLIASLQAGNYGAAIVMAALFGVWYAVRRQPVLFGLVSFTIPMALFIQPVQWHVGTWVGMGVAIVVLGFSRSDIRGVSDQADSDSGATPKFPLNT